jgi:hypothetical protein
MSSCSTIHWETATSFALLTGLASMFEYSLPGVDWLVFKTKGNLQDWDRGSVPIENRAHAARNTLDDREFKQKYVSTDGMDQRCVHEGIK